MFPRERFTSYKSLSRLVLCYKKDWATLLHFIYFYYLLFVTNYPIINYLLPLISVLAENTLLETAYHFHLLVVWFDTLTYREDYDRSPILVGHHAARKCLPITRKIMIPPPDSRDPSDGPPYFAKKMFPSLSARTHQLYLRTQGSASLLRTKNEYSPC